MKFLKTEYVTLGEYYVEDEPEDKLVPLMNKYMREWIFIHNKEYKDVDHVIYALKYRIDNDKYNNDILCVNYSKISTYKIDDENLDDVLISDTFTRSYKLNQNDVIYKLKVVDDENDDIEWWKDGKLEEKKI